MLLFFTSHISHVLSRIGQARLRASSGHCPRHEAAWLLHHCGDIGTVCCAHWLYFPRACAWLLPSSKFTNQNHSEYFVQLAAESACPVLCPRDARQGKAGIQPKHETRLDMCQLEVITYSSFQLKRNSHINNLRLVEYLRKISRPCYRCRLPTNTQSPHFPFYLRLVSSLWLRWHLTHC